MTSPHRIRLRGPWRYEWLSEEAGDFPPADRITLPKPWQKVFGSVAGSARFRRSFHQPTGLEPGSRVELVFEGLTGEARISLNDHHLGAGAAGGGLPLRYDITDILQPNNELQVMLECDPADSSEPAGLWGLVVLEIHE